MNKNKIVRLTHQNWLQTMRHCKAATLASLRPYIMSNCLFSKSESHLEMLKMS